MVDVRLDKNRREKAPLYMDGESVKGAVTIRPKDGKRLEHTGIKVQFIGTIGSSLSLTEIHDTRPLHSRLSASRRGTNKALRMRACHGSFRRGREREDRMRNC